MKKLCIIFSLVFSFVFAVNAQRLSITEPNSNTNEWEFAANCMQRLCPTVMWDGWILQDIEFDPENNTMYLLIQLRSLRDENLSEAKLKALVLFTLENLEEGYRAMLSENTVYVDGDWMLYLTLGNLLHKLADNNVNVQFVFQKPTKYNIIGSDVDLLVPPAELQKALDIKDYNE